MLKLEMCARNFSHESVAKRLFDSVLAKNHFFKMKQDGRRLENITPREIINMGRKTELKI